MKQVLALSATASFGIASAALAGGDPFLFDLSGLSSNGFQNGVDGNVTIATGISGGWIEGIEFNINATGVGVSWFEEMTYSLWDGAVGGTLLADGSTGALSYSPGSQTSFFANATASGVHELHVQFDGELIIELHEWNFDDVVGPDAFYNPGSTLRLLVPTPAAGLAVIGLFGATGRRRRFGPCV